MPLAGFLASQGELNFWLVVLTGTVSLLVSILPWYFVGRFVGKWGIQKLPQRYQRWFLLTPERLERANQWLRRRGVAAIFLSFLLPGMRNLVWVPVGMSGMRISTTLMYSCIGAFSYIVVVTYAGFLLGDQYFLVKKYFVSVYHFVLLVLIIALTILGIRYYFSHRSQSQR